MQPRVFIVEDDPATNSALADLFRRHGFSVQAFTTGAGVAEACKSARPDLVVLDLMLPDQDGFDVCRAIRKVSTVPIMIVSGRAAATDAVAGLELGADSYLEKPFDSAELIARGQALIRQCKQIGTAPGAQDILQLGDVRLDMCGHRAWVRNQEVHLTPKEFELLATLMRQPGVVQRSEYLLQSIWGYDTNIRTRTLDVHIARLRAKLELDTSSPQLVLTIRGVGYRFNAGEQECSAY